MSASWPHSSYNGRLFDPLAPTNTDSTRVAMIVMENPLDLIATLEQEEIARLNKTIPAFAPGDRVRTRLPARNAFVPGGHTRLPAYAAGQTGTVILTHGAHVFPDTNAHRMGECPEPLYTVAFAAADLWGVAEAEGDEVTLDLWQSYLEPA